MGRVPQVADTGGEQKECRGADGQRPNEKAQTERQTDQKEVREKNTHMLSRNETPTETETIWPA